MHSIPTDQHNDSSSTWEASGFRQLLFHSINSYWTTFQDPLPHLLPSPTLSLDSHMSPSSLGIPTSHWALFQVLISSCLLQRDCRTFLSVCHCFSPDDDCYSLCILRCSTLHKYRLHWGPIFVLVSSTLSHRNSVTREGQSSLLLSSIIIVLPLKRSETIV